MKSNDVRTCVVTGAASGIGAATAAWLRDSGVRVITSDLHHADVIADLASAEGRTALVDGVARLSGGRIDGVVANAGGGPSQTLLALNFFGAVATLEGLRPLLAASNAPRAAAVASISALGPVEPMLVDACLALDESAAVAAGQRALDAGTDPLTLYGSAKRALSLWCRRQAGTGWAAAGIPLNVIAPGFIDTPAAAYILTNPDTRAQVQRMVPLRGAFPGRPEQMAALLAWCVSGDNALLTGQILFADSGFECLARAEHW